MLIKELKLPIWSTLLVDQVFQKFDGWNDLAICSLSLFGLYANFCVCLRNSLSMRWDKTYSVLWTFDDVDKFNRAHYKLALLPLFMLKIENYTCHLSVWGSDSFLILKWSRIFEYYSFLTIGWYIYAIPSN